MYIDVFKATGVLRITGALKATGFSDLQMFLRLRVYVDVFRVTGVLIVTGALKAIGCTKLPSGLQVFLDIQILCRLHMYSDDTGAFRVTVFLELQVL